MVSPLDARGLVSSIDVLKQMKNLFIPMEWLIGIHTYIIRICVRVFFFFVGGGGVVAVTTKPHQLVFQVALATKTNMSVFAYTKA